MIILATTMLYQGCAKHPSSIKVMQEFPEMKKNNISILRNYNYFGGGVKYWPLVDGQEVSGLCTNEHISFSLNPGSYKLGIRFYDILFPMECSDEINVVIEDNQPKYYMVSVGFTCPEIEKISKEEALDRLKSSTRITTGKISNFDGESIKYENNEYELCFF